MFNKKLVSLAVSLALVGMLHGCGGDDVETSTPTPTPTPSPSPTPTPTPTPSVEKNFNRIAVFPVCSQVDASCESDDSTAAEIVTVSTDGMTLIYSNSPKGEIGFIDITTPSSPKAKGRIDMGGEPTSVSVLGNYAVVGVNTSASFTAPSGKLTVVDIATQKIVADITLPGQPDSVAVSKDGKYIAIAIENERDEDVNGGAMPQLPGGSLSIVDVAGAPSTWKTRNVDMSGIATLYPTDPEPEYVDINEDNIAVVTLQENNHIALVDLASGKITKHFSAGSVNLSKVDLTDEIGGKDANGITIPKSPSNIKQTEDQPNRLREPDGVSWISKTQFVTANEGDLNGGSRGFTLFNTDGSVAYDSGNSMEHLMARIGHYNDRRSDAKGNEPENAEFGRFGDKDFLFVCSERSSAVAVYDLSVANKPALKQVLPAGMAPEGVLAIPSRNLLIAASEEDSRGDNVRSVVNIYQYQEAKPKYPTLQSVDRADGTPIPWAALSGLAAGSDSTLYSVNDSFFASNRIFGIDLTQTPAQIKSEIIIKDSKGVLAGLASQLPDAKDDNAFDDTDLKLMLNADGTVNLDPEGIAVANDGGFWLASEGAGTVGDKKYPVTKPNMIVKTDAAGVIQQIIQLPADLNAVQLRFGLEGVTESNGKLIVPFQRAWNKEEHPRLGIYDLTAKTWSFMFYPLDAVASPNGGWVGLSDITALGNNQFLIVERDNMAGVDARVKKLYKIDLSGLAAGATVVKTLVRDLMADLKAPGGNVIEKVEGSAVLPNGDVYIVTDNDGVDGGNGETQLINLGKILK
ncbi:MAG: selenium-binding protein SBP56-related protein [Halothiobacillaceae bacterium]|nr:selenium-binding protein SBP56-related protein [Halothiobacillaceae bacterium]